MDILGAVKTFVLGETTYKISAVVKTPYIWMLLKKLMQQ